MTLFSFTDLGGDSGYGHIHVMCNLGPMIGQAGLCRRPFPSPFFFPFYFFLLFFPFSVFFSSFFVSGPFFSFPGPSNTSDSMKASSRSMSVGVWFGLALECLTHNGTSALLDPLFWLRSSISDHCWDAAWIRITFVQAFGTSCRWRAGSRRGNTVGKDCGTPRGAGELCRPP